MCLMDILIHYASGKTQKVNNVKDINGNEYVNYQEFAQDIFDTNYNTFDNCTINMDYVEMIEEVTEPRITMKN